MQYRASRSLITTILRPRLMALELVPWGYPFERRPVFLGHLGQIDPLCWGQDHTVATAPCA